MTASEVTREELHHRRIDMRGYQRSDGLFEVEGRVLDTKPFDFVPWSGSRFVPANAAVHDMGVRIVYDAQMTVREIATFTDAAPYAMCPEGGRALQSLVGLRMTSGWNREVRNRLSGARSCTHLMELLTPLATAAFQSLSHLGKSRPQRYDATGRPLKIDSCYAYGAEREVVLRHWPEYHRPSPKKD
ncbi:MAG: hypothetical protein K0R58_2891 [Ramlibacter sp.]|jgi:hypothetical protein|nr:hypothetical protein [Ramlibacter sp.]